VVCWCMIVSTAYPRAVGGVPSHSAASTSHHLRPSADRRNVHGLAGAASPRRLPPRRRPCAELGLHRTAYPGTTLSSPAAVYLAAELKRCCTPSPPRRRRGWRDGRGTTSDARMHPFCPGRAAVAFISTALVAHQHAVVVSAETPMRPRLRRQQHAGASQAQSKNGAHAGRVWACGFPPSHAQAKIVGIPCDLRRGYTGAHSSHRTRRRNIAFSSGHRHRTGAAAIWRAIYDPRAAAGSCSSS
jgi:hypothetical protein